MRRKAWMVGLGCASIVLTSLCGYTWETLFPANSPSLSNAVAVDRTLRLCSLTEGGQPFHLILQIAQPARPKALLQGTVRLVPNTEASARRTPGIQAHPVLADIEIFWLNAITYRVVIHAPGFSQTRVVNGSVIEEHDTGDFYPRWIQNFVDAILDPIPKAKALRKVPGAIPVGIQSHACISTPAATGDFPDKSTMAQICFQDAEPKIASGIDFTRSVWFDDFAPFGRQQIARTLVNDLPANMLLRGQVTLLEPLRKKDYSLLKAREFTPSEKQIQTILVSGDAARSLLAFAETQPQLQPASHTAGIPTGNLMAVYIRTDRTGKVREAYRDALDQFGLQDAAVAQALTLRFKPLIVDGAPRQMEAPILLPARAVAPAGAYR